MSHSPGKTLPGQAFQGWYGGVSSLCLATKKLVRDREGDGMRLRVLRQIKFCMGRVTFDS